jgi:sarcosine oxidase/L-pipecolate oxidase
VSSTKFFGWRGDADFDISRFLPNSGKYMKNVIEGKSNGEEKDKAFGWKTEAELAEVRKGSAETREWRDLDSSTSKL